jgi:hypothetical protein
MPAPAAHNITSQNDVISQVSKMFPIRTASHIISEIEPDRERVQLHRHRDRRHAQVGG